MKLSRLCILAISALGIVLCVGVAQPAHASPFTAEFTGQIAPGNANVKAPFVGTLFQSGPISGNFLFDSSLTPAPLSGFVNVPFSSIPEFADTSASTVFHVDLGAGLVFDYDDSSEGIPAIQYKDGVFRGFVFISDFLFSGNTYRLRSDGGTWTIRPIVNGVLGSSVVNGQIFGTVGNIQPYVGGDEDIAAVPEPTSLILLATGLAAAARYSRKTRRGPRV
jgi:hypothetical protein